MSDADEPQRIGRYEIRKLIGRGAMGVVYLAHDPVLGRPVALKTISLAFDTDEATRGSFEKRFFAEARAAARLSHPGIVVVHDVGRDAGAGILFMALEHLRGKPLDALVSLGRPLAWREALRTTARVAEALHHAHSKGIVHRDIKPANIMVLESGEPKVLDFGVAKLPAEKLTMAGQVFGSPAYMSPEQAQGRPLDARSDLFSLGAVLYELLTGERAFAGANAVAILTRVLRESPSPPSSRVQGLPEEVDYIVAHCLARVPAQRYASGQEIAEDIEDVLEGRPPRHREGWSGEVPASPGTGGPSTQAMGSINDSTEPGLDVAVREVKEKLDRMSATFDPGTDPQERKRPALPIGRFASLAILSGARSGEVVRLDVPRVVIGRLGYGVADLELPDGRVSRRHAVLECDGERFTLRDLESRNGTYLGEQPIGSAALPPGVEFRVGDTRMVVVLSTTDWPRRVSGDETPREGLT